MGGELDYAWAADCLGPSGNWEYWTIKNDKLYFFFEPNAKKYFLDAVDGTIASGDSRWSDWYGEEAHFSTNCYVNPLAGTGTSISSLLFDEQQALENFSQY